MCIRDSGWRGSATTTITATTADLLQRRTNASARQRLRHAHQAIAAAADRFHLFLAWQRLAFRPGDETFSLVERGDTGRLHGDITAVATGEVGAAVTVQSRFGSNLLQADGTRQTLSLIHI